MARLVLAALLVAACLAVQHASAGLVIPDASTMDLLAASSAKTTKQCSGAVGECGVDEAEELGLSGSGEALRRTLAARQPRNRYISYAALRADQVPCNQRGRSYYSNCGAQKAANPYKRGCSVITRCARNMN
ncbi:hypothetical protein HU200_030871 [Digitaria exilis]|uniref:Rapid alkalinization factor n=1 Tax=Digitaria exilis TaxID=1010633 RepID=A0A835BRN0_9POAL|nr:hypothetical protein HU200_030871 [Digitaria exilis]CAB3471832.1 unnamed protein product [Digitaria exilis]